jgi:ubiquinone/menaquinone biosynthesis C-methylase UbiE/diadenosine tetraphosphate (Ap4A) HIT family hydrolase
MNVRVKFSIDALKQRLEQTCLFCDPGDQTDQIIGRTPHFYMFVALGQIVEGYLLVVPYVHARCIAELSAAEIGELESIQNAIRQMYYDVYNQEALFFEHGMSGACAGISRGTQHCFHTHLHCVPAPVDLLPAISQTFRPIEINDLADIAKVTNGHPYLYHEREQRHVFIENQPIVPQFLRRQLANAVGVPEKANWSIYPTLDIVAVVRDELSLWLSKHRPVILTPTGKMTIESSSTLPPDVVQQTIVAYNRMASAFSETWFEHPPTNLLDRFIELLPDDQMVLDAACGPGRDTRYLLSKDIATVGVDLSIGMLNEARTRVPEGTFYQMDIRHLSFPANHFSGIWACAALVHIPEHEIPLALSCFHRVLKPGGVLFLALHESDPSMEKERIAPDGRYFTDYSEAEMRQWLKQVGLNIEEIQRQVSHRGTHSEAITVHWLNLWARKVG